MKDPIFVDRRSNPSGKSFVNQQRLLRRVKDQVKDAIKDSVKNMPVGEIPEKIKIRGVKGTKEPNFHYSIGSGKREGIVIGNKRFKRGDQIERPSGGDQGQGGKDAGTGSGEDDYTFVSRETFLDLFLEDCELPNLEKRQIINVLTFSRERAGTSTSGVKMDLKRTMRKSLGRRIALKRPKEEEITKLEILIKALEACGGDEKEIKRLQDELEALLKRRKWVLYMDPIDIRYNLYHLVPKPQSQAVIFFLMDVSGSMSEHEKYLAKVMFLIITHFLHRRYEKVEMVFIRHTDEAKEVDQETFFHSTETGGTIVSTALNEMFRVVKDRYPVELWNVYGVQVSDGDNASDDNYRSAELLKQILKFSQFFAYVEVGREDNQTFRMGLSSLWRVYSPVSEANKEKFAMEKAQKTSEVFQAFKILFSKKSSK